TSMATTGAATSFQVIDSVDFELDNLDGMDILIDANVPSMDGLLTCMAPDGGSRSKAKRKNLPMNQDLSELEKHRVYRERQKNTRKRLELQEKELTKALADLRELKAKQLSEFTSSRTPAYWHWESIAGKQKEQRLEAEADQQQLYATISLQSSYIDYLHDTLRRLCADQDMPRKKLCLKSPEPALISAYIRELDDNYTRTEEVFRNSGLSELPDTEVTVHSVRTRDCDGQVEYFQQLDKMVQPYTLRQTGHSLWKLGEAQHSSKPNYQRSYDVVDPENTIAARFVEEKALKSGETAPLVQRFIARRFEEEGCIIYTWKLVTEGAGVFNGMQLDETGWCRLLPLTDTAVLGTQIEICIRRVPMHFKSTQFRRLEIGEFHGALQEDSAGTLNKVMASLEDLLLGDVLAGIS
ncbi:hypothetical protein F442_13231, partial [Phytophthora nicotianae P10297]